jgi:Nif-specific regulatory protein
VINWGAHSSGEDNDGISESADDFFAEADSDLDHLENSEIIKSSKQLSKKLENAEHRLNMLEMLIDITKALNSTLNLNELLVNIVDSINSLADTERGFLMLSDNQGNLEFRIARNRSHEALEKEDFEVSHSIINETKKKREPMFISNLLENDRFKDQKSVIDLQLKTALCVPLTLEEKVIGVIYTDSGRMSDKFKMEDMPIISAFASQAAIAIENARLHGELILSRETLARENLELKQELSEKYKFSGIIGKSKSMQEIFSTIKKIAPHTTTVLIHGETGTGKELIARAIHFNSSRETRQMVTINCGAMPAELLESELFGHRKGAFTGASRDKKGLLETADGGTIFLDEIGDMPLPLQVKLLRVLQDGVIRRVGDNVTRKVDVRILAATNRDLSKDIEKGTFREDLYYRLNVVPIHIPPLRERQEDIIPLVEHFLNKYSSKMNKGEVRITPGAIKLLLSMPWGGNVRELENTIERALALSGDSAILSREHFPQLKTSSSLYHLEGESSLKEKLQRVEKQIITNMLNKTNGNISRAAKHLKVTRQHLHNKIKQYGITKD